MSEPFSAASRQLVETAHYIIGPGQTLWSGEAASAVAASTARKLAIPTPGPNWTWAGVKPRSLDYYARQAARGVKQAIEGEDVSPTQELDLVTILAIIGGGLLFLFIAGGLVGVALATL